MMPRALQDEERRLGALQLLLCGASRGGGVARGEAQLGPRARHVTRHVTQRAAQRRLRLLQRRQTRSHAARCAATQPRRKRARTRLPTTQQRPLRSR